MKMYSAFCRNTSLNTKKKWRPAAVFSSITAISRCQTSPSGELSTNILRLLLLTNILLPTCSAILLPPVSWNPMWTSATFRKCWDTAPSTLRKSILMWQCPNNGTFLQRNIRERIYLSARIRKVYNGCFVSAPLHPGMRRRGFGCGGGNG